MRLAEQRGMDLGAAVQAVARTRSPDGVVRLDHGLQLWLGQHEPGHGMRAGAPGLVSSRGWKSRLSRPRHHFREDLTEPGQRPARPHECPRARGSAGRGSCSPRVTARARGTSLITLTASGSLGPSWTKRWTWPPRLAAAADAGRVDLAEAP